MTTFDTFPLIAPDIQPAPPAPQNTDITDKSTILQRFARSDKTAVQDCIDTYGNLIWSLAKSKTDSIEKAEKLTAEIFNDIWDLSAHFNTRKCPEFTFIKAIICRRLFLK